MTDDITMDSILYNEDIQNCLTLDLRMMFKKYQDKMDIRNSEINYIVNKLVEDAIPYHIKELNEHIYAKRSRNYVSNSTEGSKGSVGVSEVN